jgi:Peptidase A4 family
VKVSNKLSITLSVAICAFALAIAGSSSAFAGPAKTQSKHAPIQLLRDRDGNAVADVTGALESNNWSGYILSKIQTGQAYKAIQATWTVPDVVFQGEDAFSAEWVGIGGFCKKAPCNKLKDVDKTLIQLGTAQEAFGTSDLQYFAWYEMLPFAPITTPLAVSPGDVITASLTCNGKCKGNASWTLSFTNVTTRDSFSKTVKYKSPLDSAEWIEEAPASGNHIEPLADFGTATFSDGTVNGNTADLSNAFSIVMLNPNGQTANVSDPNPSGDGFSSCFAEGSSLVPCFDTGP